MTLTSLQISVGIFVAVGTFALAVLNAWKGWVQGRKLADTQRSLNESHQMAAQNKSDKEYIKQIYDTQREFIASQDKRIQSLEQFRQTCLDGQVEFQKFRAEKEGEIMKLRSDYSALEAQWRNSMDAYKDGSTMKADLKGEVELKPKGKT